MQLRRAYAPQHRNMALCLSGGELGPLRQTRQTAIGARGVALPPLLGVAGEGTASRVDGVDGTEIGEKRQGGHQARVAGG